MRSNGIHAGRVAVGAACAIFDGLGRVLLVRHTYGRLNWELPGGASEAGEAPNETARRELLEETGLELVIERLTGVYFEVDPDGSPALHFVFRCGWDVVLVPRPSSAEIAEVGFWSIEQPPKPISDFTERRIRDAANASPPSVVTIGPRRWRT